MNDALSRANYLMTERSLYMHLYSLTTTAFATAYISYKISPTLSNINTTDNRKLDGIPSTLPPPSRRRSRNTLPRGTRGSSAS